MAKFQTKEEVLATVFSMSPGWISLRIFFAFTEKNPQMNSIK